MYNFNKDLIYFIKREGTTANPYSSITESMNVLYEKAFLKEVPVQSFRVVAKVGSSILAEVSRLEDVKLTNQYYVDYKQGIVYFHASKNNTLVNLNYRGQGVLLYPASRIYLDAEGGAKDVVKTLKDFVAENASALEALKNVEIAIENAEVVTLNANQALSQINSKMSEITASELQRIANENTRTTDENTRKSNETARSTAESTRNTNENTRKTNETARGTAETARATAETTRGTNETDRVNAETVRKNAETDRNTEETNRATNETARNTAETARASAESTRVTNENTRKTAETARINAEKTRVNAEKTRGDSEVIRVASENARISNEDARKTAETNRASAEITRANAETTRIDAETIRLANEASRVAVESARVTAESTRNTNENTRKTNETARGTAETARATEEGKRKTAETARGTAETARATEEATRLSNEASRVTAENTRATAETTRIENEDARKTTETNRASVESARVTAESGRASAESTRVTNENTRKTNETARGTAETARVTAENTRKTNETARESAETERASAEITRTTAESDRVLKESGRVTAETARVIEEGKRATAETTRQSKEDTRINSENTRISAESARVANEDKRITDENARISAESARVTAESARVSAESTRNTNENTRKSNETARVNAETVRASAETARQTSFTSAIANAERATTSANTSAQNAQSLVDRTVNRREYDSTATYYANNIITYQGSSYMCIAQSKGNLPTNEQYFQILAIKGLDGKGNVTAVNGFGGEVTLNAGHVGAYSKSETDAKITELIGSAPETLNTLNELAKALGDDPNFATTMTNNLANKVDKVTGKDLSTNDYTTAEKTKLAGIATGANNYVHPANHPASIITQDANNRFTTDAEKALWNAKASTALATNVANGLMLSIDKAKLDGIAVNANNYVHPANHPASIITQDASNRFVTDAEKALWNAKASTAVATTTADGLMPFADKVKLNSVSSGANKILNHANNGSISVDGVEQVVYTHPANHPASVITQDASNRFVTDTEKSTWNAKASTTVVTTTTDGLMSFADKVKLNGVTVGANKILNHANNGSISVDGVEQVVYAHPANHPASIIVQDASNRFVTDTEKTNWNAKATTAVVTTTVNGLMPFADKVKLNGVSTGANKTINHANNGSISVDGVEQVVYTHPANHPASVITQDASNRFVTDTEKSTWNAKETTSGAQAKANTAETNAKNASVPLIGGTMTGTLVNNISVVTPILEVKSATTIKKCKLQFNDLENSLDFVFE